MLRFVWKKNEKKKKEEEEVEKKMMVMIVLVVIMRRKKKRFAFHSNWCVYEDSKQLLSRSLHDIEQHEPH